MSWWSLPPRPAGGGARPGGGMVVVLTARVASTGVCVGGGADSKGRQHGSRQGGGAAISTFSTEGRRYAHVTYIGMVMTSSLRMSPM